MPPDIRASVRSRQIIESDFAAVIDLLTEGFPVRSRRYWESALAALASHATPPGLPKFGYLLESDGNAVGVILLIYSAIANGTAVQCLQLVRPAGVPQSCIVADIAGDQAQERHLHQCVPRAAHPADRRGAGLHTL
jgi:hypothetical protein